MLNAEARAGVRRHTGTQRGEHYQRLVGHLGEGDDSDPPPYERTLGDLLDPTRPGALSHVVNVVTRKTKIDAAAWRVDRLLLMVATLEQEQGPEMPD